MKAMILLAAMFLTSEAAAQDADIEAGAVYAEQVCSPCHAVQANETLSPLTAGHALPDGGRYARHDRACAQRIPAKLASHHA